MIVQHEEGPTKGRYWSDDGAELTYSVAGKTLIIIDHTEVPEALAGQGVGLALVTRAVDEARAAGRKIVPLCPYAFSQFRRHPDWRDVWNGAPNG